MMHKLRDRVENEIIDHDLLIDVLRGYKKPRDKISALLKSQDIIRIKKGLYIFGNKWRRSPVSKEVLANLIYGPSYISLEYALGFYGLIPERVESVTSMTTGKSKKFETPLGYFSYQYLDQKKYPIGTTYLQIDGQHSVFIASKEKALADHIAIQSNLDIKDVYPFLTENMRIEVEDLSQLNAQEMREIASVYKNHRVTMLSQLVGRS